MPALAVAGRRRRVLVEGGLLGHDTHGLALLAGYLSELDQGRMTRRGSYDVVNARGAAALWDGKRLPGPWLLRRALQTAATMARTHGTGTIVVSAATTSPASPPTCARRPRWAS